MVGVFCCWESDVLVFFFGGADAANMSSISERDMACAGEFARVRQPHARRRRQRRRPCCGCSPPRPSVLPLTAQCSPQQTRNQNASAPSFVQSASLTEPLFNLDSNAAAKQMAALNVVNMQRQLANAYPRLPASSPSQALGGTAPGSFLGGFSSPYNQPNVLQPTLMDAPAPMQFSPHSSLQPAFAPVHSFQPNPAPLEPPMPSSNVPPRHSPNIALIKQKQRGFLASLANVHLSRGSPLPPALTAVQYPPNYDPASSQWKSLECSSEPGAFRLAGKDVDLFRLWGIVWQFGGGQKVFLLIPCIIRQELTTICTQSSR